MSEIIIFISDIITSRALPVDIVSANRHNNKKKKITREKGQTP